ncbi:homoserine O-acetyltransferase MetX [Methanobrevibacter filiformis]|uniref:Homoserine O-acetyltransferase n=1 Tax=Methanobrevibacter filiformis TaxID=55758 RepID=A0A166FEC0_9EURY|nr:homoserine O-acetyltransferase [Methanobrevibacter filiformis]KZX17586.1 homoserine O-acetyltransferase [Methanobrevibacter filiformis]
MKKESVGTVETEYLDITSELKLESGKTLKNVTIAYETYGTLNKNKDNGILICHALSGDAHAAGWHEGDTKPGWWEIIIGPGKSLDTEKYFIISSNVIGGCKGSTGPSSINPDTGEEYGLDFPVVTIKDMTKAQNELVKHFGIKQLFAVIGGSMGGMQVLQWTVSYPEMVKKAIPIATTARSSPQQIAFNEVGRQAIVSDPAWNKGDYYSKNFPENGLSLARMIAHITYLSDESMYEKFGRNLQNKDKISYDFELDFQVESYLHYQGKSFVKRFDANSYLYITKAIDYFDLSINGSLIQGLKNVKSKINIIAIDSDWLYPTSQSKEILTALNANEVDVKYHELQSSYGHDAFLLEHGQLNYIIAKFLQDIQVEDILSENISTLSKDAKIEDVAILMMDEYITHVPIVTEDNILVGIVTAWDLSKSIATSCDNLEAIMTRNVKTCKSTDSIETIARKMKKYDISCLPVVDDNSKLEGLVTTDQISHLMTN